MKIDATHGWPRLWHGLHVAGGMYALVFILAMALTGLTWSFSWYRNGFYTLLGADTTQMQQFGGGHGGNRKEQPQNNAQSSEDKTNRQDRERTHGQEGRRGQHREAESETTDSLRVEKLNRGHRPDGQTGATQTSKHTDKGSHGKQIIDTRSWTIVYDTLLTIYPNRDFKSITIQDGKASVALAGMGNQRASDSYTFERRTGKITSQKLYIDGEKSAKIRGWIYSVHVGSWGGLPTRILAFLAALLGASLPLTGYYLWIKRILKKKK